MPGARFIFRGTQTLNKQIEYELWLIKSCKRIVLGFWWWWKTLTMHNWNRNRYLDWYKQKAIKHILMTLMIIEVCADLCRLWECEDGLRGPAHGAGCLPPLSSISWHWPVSLQQPSTPTTCPAEAHQNLETNIKILLGKLSIKKTILLLTFVNKRGGLERASSIKKKP